MRRIFKGLKEASGWLGGGGGSHGKASPTFEGSQPPRVHVLDREAIQTGHPGSKEEPSPRPASPETGKADAAEVAILDCTQLLSGAVFYTS